MKQAGLEATLAETSHSRVMPSRARGRWELGCGFSLAGCKVQTRTGSGIGKTPGSEGCKGRRGRREDLVLGELTPS